MQELDYWLWLSSLTGVRPTTRFRLLELLGSPESIWNAEEATFIKAGIAKGERIQLLSRNSHAVEQIYAHCKSQNIVPIPLNSESYPQRLKQIYDPPVVLFVKGILPEIDSIPVVSVIGTRSASPYGIRMGNLVANDICTCGGVVVSGLTSGIDAAAAEGALDAGGKCIGVLGTSHEAATGKLAERVLKSGALISEYPPGTVSNRSFFRARNRISAGLSVCVAVIESPEKSGTHLFVQEALEQGRDIYVLLGSAESPNSIGLVKMMRDGATPFISGQQIMKDYADQFPNVIPTSNTESKTKAAKHSRAQSKQNFSVDRTGGSDYIVSAEQTSGKTSGLLLQFLTPDQKSICDAIASGALYTDDIAQVTGLPMTVVLSQLTMLEIQKVVTRQAGKIYRLA